VTIGLFQQNNLAFQFGGGAASGFGRAAVRAPIDWAPDLGTQIGSKNWWRGLATLCLLCGTTFALRPRFDPLPSVSRPALAPEISTIAQAQTIKPLALGGAMGRVVTPGDAVQLLADAPERPQLLLTTAIGAGDGLRAALQRAGVSVGDATRVLQLTSSIADPATIMPGTQLAMTLGRRPISTSPRPLDALSFRARFDTKLAFARVNGTLVMQRQPIAIDTKPFRITGLVGDSVFLSATAAGAPPVAVQAYIQALAPKAEFGALSADARYDMIIERQRAASGETRFGKLLYVGLSQGKEAIRMIEWTVAGRTQWYDPAGVGQTRPGFATPVEGARKTSGFGWRLHPLLGYSRLHQGTDYGARQGTPIRAATDGVVTLAGWHGGHGKMVKLQHAGTIGSGYAHMSQIAVSTGQRVEQGQVVGYVGSTGLSTGPHLHFEVYKNGVAVDPSRVTFAATSLLSGAELQAFRDKFSGIVASAR
jgi:murein DD-endopeptidase MepM/ murein hydrolase activator NlpD